MIINMKLNPLTLKKIRRFKSIRRGYYSFLLFVFFLLIAIFAMPYGYYTLLRIALCFISGMIAYKLYEKDGAKGVFLGYLFIAIVYNPIIKVTFAKELWVLLNLLTK